MERGFILKKEFPEGLPDDDDKYNELLWRVINMLAEANFTICQARNLFFDILKHFDSSMPVNNNVKHR